jgi:hypothetical protein
MSCLDLDDVAIVVKLSKHFFGQFSSVLDYV